MAKGKRSENREEDARREQVAAGVQQGCAEREGLFGAFMERAEERGLIVETIVGGLADGLDCCDAGHSGERLKSLAACRDSAMVFERLAWAEAALVAASWSANSSLVLDGTGVGAIQDLVTEARIAVGRAAMLIRRDFHGNENEGS